ncbi:MAG: arginine--tRNA ligase [Clostridia bacterium]|nr:arginine--tRNA ligase [Clostridia bacterium]
MTTEQKYEVAKRLNISELSEEEILTLLQETPNKDCGDVSLPCFKLAKVMRKSPVVIAEEIKNSFKTDETITKCEAVNGYLNFYFNTGKITETLINKILKEENNFGNSNEGEGKTICMDYSSINIAKPFHIGHLFTTVLGGSLYKIYKKLGYNPIGINHLGDWGTQFGKLIVAFKKWSSLELLNEKGMDNLLEIYVKFHKEAETHPELNDEARHYFKLIEDGDSEVTELFNLFKKITLEEVKKVYDRLNIEFDSYNGESFYNDKMDAVIKELEEKNLLVESEGAKVVDLEEYGMPPCLILKKDGATLYATRDLACAFYRKKTYDFYKNLYIVAYQQNLHFKQVFKVIDLMGYKWANDCVHIPFGMVSLEDGAMSTREGKVVLLRDALNRAAEKSLEKITEKNPNLQNKEEVAEQVGVGAVIFSTLYNNRIKDFVFSYDKVLNFDGETGPYVQYTNARINSIMEKIGTVNYSDADFSSLDNEDAENLVATLNQFQDTLRAVLNKYEPSFLSRYLVKLSQNFNKFYLTNRIVGEEKGVLTARYMLIKAVHIVIVEGLRLLGIEAPMKM